MTQLPYAPNQKSSGLAVTSMVLGIISLALFCVWYIALPCAIVGLVLGIVASGKVKRGEAAGAGMAKAGIICSIVALGLAIIVTILAIVGISMFGQKIRQIQQQQLQQMQQQQLHSTPVTPQQPATPNP